MLQSIWYKLCVFILRWLFIVWGGRVFGRQYIPKTGGAVIASNHQSFLDPPLSGITLSRPLYFLARQELFESNRFFSFLIRSLNAIPLERRPFSSDAIRKTIKYLSDGKLFLVFPEGTRTFDGQIQPFKPGIIMLAQKAGVPVIPARVSGAYQAWPRRSAIPIRWYPIRIIYGKPIRIKQDASLQETCEVIYQAVCSLVP